MSLFQSKKENVVIGVRLTPPRPSGRQFGKILSINSSSNSKTQKSNTKKVVKVRRTPNSSNEPPISSPSRSQLDKTIVFSPGSVGLELEHVEEDPSYSCRVVRFFDGGPKRPGQARESGKIKPGDLILSVEANGIVSSSSDDIIEILKDSSATRTVTFRSVWEPSFLDSQSMLTFPLQQEEQKTSRTSTPKRQRQPSLAMDITLIHSPSQSALLPHVLEKSQEGPLILPLPLSNKSPSMQQFPDLALEPQTPTTRTSNLTTPNMKRRINDESPLALTPDKNIDGPKENSEMLFSPSNVKKFSLQVQTEKPEQVEVPEGKDSPRQTMFSRVFGTMYKSFSPTASKSSSVGHTVAHNIVQVPSFASRVTNKIGEAIVGHSFQDVERVSQLKSDLMKEFNSAKMAISAQDIVKKGLKESMDGLATETVLLRAEFEDKLKAAKIQHATAETELKELYASTCRYQEIRINNLETRCEELAEKETKQKDLEAEIARLQSDNNMLKEVTTNLKQELEMSQTMAKEMEEELVRSARATADSMQELTESLREKEKEIEGRKSIVSSLTEEKGGLFGHIDELEKGVLELQTENKELQNDLKKTRNELVDAQKEISSFHDSVSHKLENGEAQKEELKVTTEKLGLLSSRLQRVQDERDAYQANLCEAEEELSQAVDLIKMFDKDLKVKDKALHEMNSQIEKLTKSESLLMNEKVELCEQILELQAKFTSSTEEVCKYKSSDASLQSKVKLLRKKYKQLEAELKDRDKDCKTQEKQPDKEDQESLQEELKLYEIIKDTEMHRDKLKGELEKASSDLTAKNAALEALQVSNQSLQAEISRSRTLKCTNEAAREALQRCLRKVETELQELRQEMEIGNKDREKQLYSEVVELQKTICKLKADLVLKHLHCKELDRSIASQSGALSSLNKGLVEASTNYSRVLASLHETKEVHQSEVESMERDILNLRENLEERDQEIESLLDKNDSLSSKNSSLLTSVSGLEETLTRREKDFEEVSCDMKTQIKSFEDRQIAYIDEINNLKQEINDIESDRGTLKSELEKAGLDLAVKNAALEGLEASNQSLQLEVSRSLITKGIDDGVLEELKRSLHNQSQELKDEKERRSYDENEINTMKTTISSLRQLTDEKDQQLEILIDSNENMSDENTTLRNTIAGLEESLARTKKDFEEASCKTTVQLMIQAAHADEINHLKQEISDIEIDRDTLKAKLEKASSDLTMKNAALEALEVSNESLQLEVSRSRSMKCFEEAAREGLRRSLLLVELESRELRNEIKMKNTDLNTAIQERIQAEENHEQEVIELQKAISKVGAESVENNIQHSRVEEQAASQKKSSPVASFQSAFKKQKLVLFDLQASETLLSDFMKEVTNFGVIAESEMKGLLKTLRLYQVSTGMNSRISELDLAIGKPSNHHLKELETELERLASLANDGVKELIMRRQEFEKWQTTRNQPPSTPAIPSKASTVESTKISPFQDVAVNLTQRLNEKLYTPLEKSNVERESMIEAKDTKEQGVQCDGESIKNGTDVKELRDQEVQCSEEVIEGTTLTEDAPKLNEQTKLAGAQLLSGLLESRAKLEMASAFRKWSCVHGVMRASMYERQASIELSLQLEQTRKKLAILKAHLKKGKRASVVEKKKPRFKKVFSTITEHVPTRTKCSNYGERIEI